MKDNNCIFCKIANGEIPSATIYEDDTFRVFMDLGPATKGHALIVPKDHAADLFELPEETAAAAMKLAKKLGAGIRSALHADGMNIVQNNGEAAGQTVAHFHLHMIPRYENDGQTIHWEPREITPEKAAEIAYEIMAGMDA